jgi:protein SCO1/2
MRQLHQFVNSDSLLTRRLAALLVVAVFVVPLASCRQTLSEPPPIRKYQLRGQVVRVDTGRRTATIKHETIEGWMEAMTMDFPVREDRDLNALSPERAIVATVHVQDLEFWIADVKAVP